jgi:S1-C subfamily serine protease
MHRSLIVVAASLIAVAGSATLAPARASLPARTPDPAADDAGATYKRLMDSVAPAIVSIKFVMKMEGGRGGGEEGQDMEVTALMMEPAGLALVSNIKMGGFASRMGMTANPTNIKVLIGDDTEGLKAKILARDSELDLCWVQIDDEKAKGKTFAAVDFTSGSNAALGDRLFSVQRMGKFFDHALNVTEGRIGGVTKKPRALLVPTGFSAGPRELLGSPMFNADGKVVGVNIAQFPDKEDMEGGESGGEGNSGVLLLPAAEVVKATVRGKEMAAKNPVKDDSKAEVKKDDKDAKDAKPAPMPEKKDEPKKP